MDNRELWADEVSPAALLPGSGRNAGADVGMLLRFFDALAQWTSSSAELVCRERGANAWR